MPLAECRMCCCVHTIYAIYKKLRGPIALLQRGVSVVNEYFDSIDGLVVRFG